MIEVAVNYGFTDEQEISSLNSLKYYTGGAQYRAFFGTTVAHIVRPREWVAEVKYSF